MKLSVTIIIEDRVDFGKLISQRKLSAYHPKHACRPF